MISIFKIEFMDGRDRLRCAPADPAMTILRWAAPRLRVKMPFSAPADPTMTIFL